MTTVFSQYIEDDYPECPSNLGYLYKGCKGELQQCSKCLGNAENECLKLGNPTYVCYGCTAALNYACTSAKKMCFGKADCQNGERCLGYTCTT